MVDEFEQLEFENGINALIPMAEKEARDKVELFNLVSEQRPGAVDKVTGKGVLYNHCYFTAFFHRAMKRLAIENGLRKF